MKSYFYINKWIIPFSIILIAISGCVNLKTVADYSVASTSGIKNFDQIDYSFLRHCLDRCEDDAIQKFEIKRMQECSCGLYSQADSVTQIIYNGIVGYFEGLGQLSQNELTTYSTDALIGEMSAQELRPLKIDEQSVTAFANLSNTLLRASTDFYRRKKIQKYIEDANEPIQILLEKFQQIIGTNLKGELRFKRERLYAYYMDMKMNRTLTSDYEKMKAATEYYQILNSIQQKEMQLNAFAKSLNEIAQGHQVLYENRNKLSVKDFQGLLNGYSSNVKDLISEFNKLNN